MSQTSPNRVATAAPARAAVLVDDQATAALLMGVLAVAGARVRAELSTLDAALAALDAGQLDHLVVGDALVTPELAARGADARGVFVLRNTSARPAVVDCGALPGAEWPLGVNALTEAVLGVPRAGAGHGKLEIYADGLDVASLLAMVARSRADLKLSFVGAAQDAGICFCGGKIRAAALAGRPARIDADVAGDPALSELVGLWQAGDVDEDLGYVCDHGDAFAQSAGYQRYAAKVLAWLLGNPLRRLRFEGHEEAELGVDTLGALQEANHLAGKTRPRAVGARIRPRTGSRKRVTTDPGRGGARLEEHLCGDPAGYYRRLLMAAGNGRTETTPLPGTRLTPSAEVLGDCLVFYRQRSAQDSSWLGVMTSRAGHQEIVTLRRRRWDDPADARRAFARREGLLRAAIQHRNLVPVLDAARYEEEDVTVMRHVHGLTLAELIERLPAMGRTLAPRWVAWIGAMVARGLHGLHVQAAGLGGMPSLVHRAVAPEGVVLGFDGLVRVVDFDVLWSDEVGARVLDAFEAGGAVRAPEAVVGGPIAPRSDQVSVGALLYELLVGKRLLRSEALAERAPLRELRPSVPNGLAWVIDKACEVEASARYHDCDALAQALLSEAETDDDAARRALGELAERAAGRIRRQEAAAIERMTRSARAMWENEFFEERGDPGNPFA